MIAIAEGLTLDESALAELQAGFRGQIVGRDDPSYDEHRRIWNGSIDRRPALIARCAGAADVMAAVRFGRRTGLAVAVRSGGHSFPGMSTCDDGLVIDTSLMKGVRVGPETRRVRAQAGVLLGELDRETQAFGLAVPAGIVTHTGVAGLTLGGGIGWLQRKHGLTIDQLTSVDLITADGEFVKCSQRENPDLFWGVRGGGPPPLTPQNRSGFSRWLHFTNSPSAVMRSTEVSWSIVSPCLRCSQPMPPPSVSPATPVCVTIPAGTASPNACVSRSSSPRSTPACTRTVRRPGSTRTPFMSDRSITRPSSHVECPGKLCPPPRTATR